MELCCGRGLTGMIQKIYILCIEMREMVRKKKERNYNVEEYL